MPDYTIVNLMELDNRAQEGGSTTDARFARDAIESEHIGLSHIKYEPGKRSARAHSHKQQEEVYLVLSGSGQVKLDDETQRGPRLGRRAGCAEDVPRVLRRPRRARADRDRLRPARGRRRRLDRRRGLVGRLSRCPGPR